MADIVEKWKDAARRDDLFDHMVPSDVRELIAEIERLRAENTAADKAGYERGIEEMRSVLKLTQWGFNHKRCPVCAGFNCGPNGETDLAHTKDCPVGRALKEKAHG